MLSALVAVRLSRWQRCGVIAKSVHHKSAHTEMNVQIFSFQMIKNEKIWKKKGGMFVRLRQNAYLYGIKTRDGKQEVAKRSH